MRAALFSRADFTMRASFPRASTYPRDVTLQWEVDGGVFRQSPISAAGHKIVYSPKLRTLSNATAAGRIGAKYVDTPEKLTCKRVWGAARPANLSQPFPELPAAVGHRAR